MNVRITQGAPTTIRGMALTMDARIPKPEVRGVGHVLYRCADCNELMEPEAAVLVDGRSFHPEHAPTEDSDGK